MKFPNFLATLSKREREILAEKERQKKAEAYRTTGEWLQKMLGPTRVIAEQMPVGKEFLYLNLHMRVIKTAMAATIESDKELPHGWSWTIPADPRVVCNYVGRDGLVHELIIGEKDALALIQSWQK